MLAVKIVCVGKLKEQFNLMAVKEYEKRLGAFCRFEVIEISESRLPENPSDSQIQQGLITEGKQILSKAKGEIVPLCIEGKLQSSEDMAKLLSGAMEYPGSISFIIGSSFGLSEEVKKSGKGISMSRMTFPHGLARVILTEQIYRGFQILQGAKYHK